MKYLRQIEENALSHPERIAVKASTGKSLTYGELWSASEAIANHIASYAISAHEPVIVYGHKDPRMIACFLGCLKSGHPYVPIDMHSVPDDRARAIAAQIGNPLVFDFGGGVAVQCRYALRDGRRAA